ncbi:hypothetical protein I5Q34_27920 [Streptomyces sp. AV19]|nr:hypothetical protein [Streptomyces sp. AV19]
MTDTEEIGEAGHGAQAAFMEDGERDVFAATDLLAEDSAAGAGPAWSASSLVAGVFGLRRLPGSELFGRRCRSPGRGCRRRRAAAYSGPNVAHQARTVS